MAGTAPGTVRVTDGAEDLAGSHQEAFGATLTRTVEVLRASAVPFGLLGGVASAGYGRPRWTKDIDVFCRPEDADRVLDVLEAAGFAVERTNPSWIYKAFHDGVQIDVIFKAKGGIYFDERMESRVRWVELAGVEVPAIPPEDLVVIKAIVHDEESPRHWHDALGVLANTELDWDYLVERARLGPNRVLALLHYALSVDVPVPTSAIIHLHELVAATWS
jgi:predicted nucleotidyltransferase